MPRVLLAALLLSLSSAAFAQAPPTAVVVNPATASMTFQSPDHNVILLSGEASAGQPMISGYQFVVFSDATDVTTGTPIAVGPVTPKTAAALQPGVTPPTYKLTFLQVGMTVGTGSNQLPPCTVIAPATCPRYTALLIAVGPDNRASARALTSESNPFLLASLGKTNPASPTLLVIVP